VCYIYGVTRLILLVAVYGAFESPRGAVYNLGLRMRLVGEYGPATVEPASLGRVKVVYR
jgi:hypothetical protein